MPDEALFANATLRDRFIAAVTQGDETAAQRLAPLTDGPEALSTQREEAWAFLSAGVRWAARALEDAGVEGADESPVSNSDAAFVHAQKLESKSWQLSQQEGFHDNVALVVDAVRRACYAGAELGPIPGGRLGSFKHPASQPAIVGEVEPRQTDLQDIGSSLGEALVRLRALGLADAVEETAGLLRPVTA